MSGEENNTHHTGESQQLMMNDYLKVDHRWKWADWDAPYLVFPRPPSLSTSCPLFSNRVAVGLGLGLLVWQFDPSLFTTCSFSPQGNEGKDPSRRLSCNLLLYLLMM